MSIIIPFNLWTLHSVVERLIELVFLKHFIMLALHFISFVNKVNNIFNCLKYLYILPYEPSCPSVGWSVDWSVGQSVLATFNTYLSSSSASNVFLTSEFPILAMKFLHLEYSSLFFFSKGSISITNLFPQSVLPISSYIHNDSPSHLTNDIWQNIIVAL